jgi:hypothetical protein
LSVGLSIHWLFLIFLLGEQMYNGYDVIGRGIAWSGLKNVKQMIWESASLLFLYESRSMLKLSSFLPVYLMGGSCLFVIYIWKL